MATLHLELYFTIDEIDCTADALGLSITCFRSPMKMQLTFPESHDGFTFTHAASALMDDATGARIPDLVEHAPDHITLRIVQVVVQAEYEDLDPDIDVEDVPSNYPWTMVDAARAFVLDTINWVRVEVGQSWVSPPEDLPRLVSAVQLFKLVPATGMAVGTRTITAPGGTLRVVDGECFLSAAALPKLESAVRGGAPGQERLLIADATHLAQWKPDQASTDRAVLYAAIAVEIAAKRCLRDCAGEAQSSLVDIILDNPRDVSMSAHGIFARMIPIVAGFDLTEEWKRVARGVQALFTLRNGIVHRGESAGREEAQSLVRVGAEAVALLAELPDKTPPPDRP